MASISTYPIDSIVTARDKWIGTDVAGTVTKNFSAEDVATFLNSSGSIESNFSRFTYKLPIDKISGSISLSVSSGSTIPMSDVTSLVFSNIDKSKTNISGLYDSLIGTQVLIQDASDRSVFSIYNWNGSSINEDDSSFSDVSIEFVGGQGSFNEDSDYLISLFKYEQQLDKHYAHNQNNASSVWNVTHNLGKHPSVSVVLSTGQQGLADVQYINNNELTITLLSAQSGKAYLN